MGENFCEFRGIAAFFECFIHEFFVHARISLVDRKLRMEGCGENDCQSGGSSWMCQVMGSHSRPGMEGSVGPENAE